MKYYALLLIYFIVTIGTSFAQTTSNLPSKSVRLTVNITDDQQPDSVNLYLYDGSGDINYPDRKYNLRKSENGKYVFVIEGIDHPVHFSLFVDKTGLSYPNFIINHFLAEPSDDVMIQMQNNPDVSRPVSYINYYHYFPYEHKLKNGKQTHYEPLFQFSGKGSEKYACRYEADLKALAFRSTVGIVVNKHGIFQDNNHCDSAKQAAFEIIEKYKHKLSIHAYQILQADAEADYERERIFWFKNYMRASHPDSDTTFYGNAYRSYVSKMKKSTLSVSYEAKKRSFNFAPLAAEYYYYFKAGLFANKANININKNVLNTYDTIKLHYNSELRDKILTAYLKLTYQTILSRSEAGMALVKEAQQIINTSNCLTELNDFLVAYSNGTKAYDFQLRDATGSLVKLSDYLGKVVFIDYWFTGCTACAHYYKSTVSKVEEKFANNDKVVFMTICVDSNKDQWLNSIKKGIYTSSKMINLYTDGKGYDHPACKFYQVTGAPRPILVGKNGFIFSNNRVDLRQGGVEGLTRTIELALAEK